MNISKERTYELALWLAWAQTKLVDSGLAPGASAALSDEGRRNPLIPEIVPTDEEISWLVRFFKLATVPEKIVFAETVFKACRDGQIEARRK
jgi:hypothetical protein